MLTEEEKNAGLEGKIIPINIEEQMKSAYIDYSMSVIVSRALPDVRDGLKPVHRRILYDMSAELNLYSDKPTRKSARIVGDVLGKFHPHGDISVYGAMVRMAQDWSMRYPLVEGQGNFGSMDGDSAAAMRYTEARLTEFAMALMEGLNDNAVDFRETYDGEEEEPVVMPSMVPNLLCNGSAGIAVGMATSFSYILTLEEVPVSVSSFVLSLTDNKILIPAAGLMGACIMMLADCVVQLVMPSLPIGIITSILGGPIFMLLILRQKKEIW